MRVHHRECFFSSTIGGKSRRFAEKVPLQPRSHGEPGLHAVPEAHCRLQEVARWPRNPAVLCRCRNGLAKKSAEAPGRRTDARVAPATSTARVGAGRCPAVRKERCRDAPGGCALRSRDFAIAKPVLYRPAAIASRLAADLREAHNRTHDAEQVEREMRKDPEQVVLKPAASASCEARTVSHP